MVQNKSGHRISGILDAGLTHVRNTGLPESPAFVRKKKPMRNDLSGIA